MNTEDRKTLRALVKNYPIHDLIHSLQEAIENQVDELVDINAGHAPMTKELTRVAWHLSIFRKGDETYDLSLDK